MDMPSSCIECNLQQYEICHAVRKSIVGTPTDLKNKPYWCPLKPMPEKEVLLTYPEYRENDYSLGYNACIDELLKGEER